MSHFMNYDDQKKYRQRALRRYILDLKIEVYDRWKGFADSREMPFRALLVTAVEEYIQNHSIGRETGRETDFKA